MEKPTGSKKPSGPLTPGIDSTVKDGCGSFSYTISALSSTSGAASCTQTRAGYQAKDDKSGEEKCDAGTYSAAGEAQCSACGAGSYRGNTSAYMYCESAGGGFAPLASARIAVARSDGGVVDGVNSITSSSGVMLSAMPCPHVCAVRCECR